ncbi:PREDICTED: uncharacterized protein LOC108499307 [Lepidothrix coronata]|uniref:Uncharacterized protein LOC108499307 n=1 Tax=Lepidothrix coronata TaxID=321398 RepID=A0A6J0HIW5_9PASS|nr:PREDICTED: uncharacterized protein LOC108499307 [Lepidothrix coronata]
MVKSLFHLLGAVGGTAHKNRAQLHLRLPGSFVLSIASRGSEPAAPRPRAGGGDRHVTGVFSQGTVTDAGAANPLARVCQGSGARPRGAAAGTAGAHGHTPGVPGSGLASPLPARRARRAGESSFPPALTGAPESESKIKNKTKQKNNPTHGLGIMRLLRAIRNKQSHCCRLVCKPGLNSTGHPEDKSRIQGGHVNTELICKVQTCCQDLTPSARGGRRFEAVALALPSLKYFHLYCRNRDFTTQFCPLKLPVSSDAPNPFRHLIQCLTMNTK